MVGKTGRHYGLPNISPLSVWRIELKFQGRQVSFVKISKNKCFLCQDLVHFTCLVLRSIHAYFRSTNVDYRGSGFDRGHLAAAGNHWINQESLDETFLLSNISPQVMLTWWGASTRAVRGGDSVAWAGITGGGLVLKQIIAENRAVYDQAIFVLNNRCLVKTDEDTFLSGVLKNVFLYVVMFGAVFHRVGGGALNLLFSLAFRNFKKPPHTGSGNVVLCIIFSLIVSCATLLEKSWQRHRERNSFPKYPHVWPWVISAVKYFFLGSLKKVFIE